MPSSTKAATAGSSGSFSIRRMDSSTCARYAITSATVGRLKLLAAGVPGERLRFVVAVEQVAIQRMEQSIVRLLFREDKSLEEPRGVGQVPLRRTDVGNRLGNMVLGTQRAHRRSLRERTETYRVRRMSSGVTADEEKESQLPKRSVRMETSGTFSPVTI